MTKTNDCFRLKDGKWIHCPRQQAYLEEPLWIEVYCDSDRLWTAYIMGRGGFMSKNLTTLKGYRSLSLAKQAAIKFANTRRE